MSAIRSLPLAFTLMFLTSVSVFAADDAAKPAEGALKDLQGQWKFEWLDADGERRRPEAEQLRTPLIVSGDQIQHGENKVSCIVDGSTDPKLIDIVVSKGTDAERTFEGIYKLEADTWTVCLFLDDGTKQRPVSFETKPNSRLIVFTFARMK